MHLCLTMLLIFLCLSFCIILLPSGTLFLLPDKIHLVFFFFTVCWLVINHLSFYLAGNVLFHFHFLETLCVGIEFLVSSYFLLVFRSVLPLFYWPPLLSLKISVLLLCLCTKLRFVVVFFFLW